MDAKKILIIDDEENFAAMVKMNLEEVGGYNVLTESRGLRAVSTVRQFKPDMIFLDIIMPD